jgi:protein subunit release factor A
MERIPKLQMKVYSQGQEFKGKMHEFLTMKDFHQTYKKVKKLLERINEATSMQAELENGNILYMGVEEIKNSTFELCVY